ncbi:uncharacterized protein VNE69_07212 [Vairimorpha necatrix]|uniref:Uncharacterized protein n=1 Tax=Vairimorpha necatrix TaxID=6039 RepID=A0AAX4JEE0_9MICR
MQDDKQIRKFTRRSTRSKTQFINFNKEEINNLRLETTKNNVKDDELENKSINLEITQTQPENKKAETNNKRKEMPIEEIFGTKVLFNNTPVKKEEKLTEKEERTYSFSGLLEWCNKIEKRELNPKNKFEYYYKKNKNSMEKENDDQNEERNIIHMRIEEDIIPCLSNNPFIQADRYYKNKY